MTEPDRQPGWDKQAVNRIAKDQYGGLPQMFEAHGWSTNGKVISQIAPTKVASAYGSIEAFVQAHEGGGQSNFILDPLAVVKEDNPKVLLTSYYAFTPWDWPCLTFTDKSRRDEICDETQPGFLAVIYGSASQQTARSERGRLIGIYQCSHRIGPTEQFLSPAGLKRKHEVQRNDAAWAYAIQAIRAWRVAPDSAPLVTKFAPQAYDPDRGIAISRYGTWLSPAEARGILKLDLVPEPVFGFDEQVVSALAPAEEALRPSRPGPVSQSSYMVGEAEGPKYLYILRLKGGNADHFLGRSAEGRKIIKVGFSKSPATRCRAHNSALPACAFKWHVLRSTLDEGLDPFPTSDAAKAGEQEMIRLLTDTGRTLGGEFFLASDTAIEEAWEAGKSTAAKRKT